MPQVKGKQTRKPAARRPAPVYTEERTQVSSVIFGLVMVVALIVAGAAFLGGSLSQVSKRWASVMDGGARTLGLSVDSVEVIGLEHLPATARAVGEAAMIAPGENMFRADPHLIRRRIEDTRLVANVRVYRLWPDTVMIYADAARPTALWFDGETWAVVDSLGRVVPRARAADHADLVKTVGMGGPEAVPALQGALATVPEIAGRVELARRVAGWRWDLELDSGAIIRLPADEQLATGMTSLARMEFESGVTRRAIAAIDLRVAGRVFLTPLATTIDQEESA